MRKPKDKGEIVAWAIQVEYKDGSLELLADMPDDVSQVVDDWLTEYERGEEGKDG